MRSVNPAPRSRRTSGVPDVPKAALSLLLARRRQVEELIRQFERYQEMQRLGESRIAPKL